MTLRFEVESLADLPPETAALYKAEGGRYRLDVTEPDAIRKALITEREARRGAERQARTAEDELARLRVQAHATEVKAAGFDAMAAQADALRARVLESAVAAAARDAGMHPAAAADCLRAARDAFEVDDTGTVTAKQGGQTLGEWAAAQRDVAPHWWPISGSGSGAPQSRRPGSSSMSRRAFEQLSPAQRSAVARSGTQIKD